MPGPRAGRPAPPAHWATLPLRSPPRLREGPQRASPPWSVPAPFSFAPDGRRGRRRPTVPSGAERRPRGCGPPVCEPLQNKHSLLVCSIFCFFSCENHSTAKASGDGVSPAPPRPLSACAVEGSSMSWRPQGQAGARLPRVLDRQLGRAGWAAQVPLFPARRGQCPQPPQCPYFGCGPVGPRGTGSVLCHVWRLDPRVWDRARESAHCFRLEGGLPRRSPAEPRWGERRLSRSSGSGTAHPSRSPPPPPAPACRGIGSIICLYKNYFKNFLKSVLTVARPESTI